jgi:hypothetical protein
MADTLADGSGPSAPLEIVAGATYTGTLTFADLADTLSALAEAIELRLYSETDEATGGSFHVASLGQGIAITGDDTASVTLAAATTSAFPLGRHHFEVWLTLLNGEAFRTDHGVANVHGRAP